MIQERLIRVSRLLSSLGLRRTTLIITRYHMHITVYSWFIGGGRKDKVNDRKDLEQTHIIEDESKYSDFERTVEDHDWREI